METVITGGCYCGAIRYRITKQPIYLSICYCSNCRRAVGAQSVAWLTVESECFELMQGTPVRYFTETQAWRTFCSSCGTSLTYQRSQGKHAHLIDVTVGSTDHPEQFAPKLAVCEDERLYWEPILPGTNPV